jgi:hypothetical protein
MLTQPATMSVWFTFFAQNDDFYSCTAVLFMLQRMQPVFIASGPPTLRLGLVNKYFLWSLDRFAGEVEVLALGGA